VRRAELKIEDCGRTESAVILAVAGELDMSTIDALAGRIGTELERPVQSLTIDLGDLAFMDSTGLRLLIELNDRALREGWRLALVTPRHEAASRVLTITGAEAALPFQSENGR